MRATSVFPFYHLRGSSQLEQELLAAGGSKGFLSLWHFSLHLNFHRNHCNNTAALLHKLSALQNQSGKYPLHGCLFPGCKLYLCKMVIKVVSTRKVFVFY